MLQNFQRGIFVEYVELQKFFLNGRSLECWMNHKKIYQHFYKLQKLQYAPSHIAM